MRLNRKEHIQPSAFAQSEQTVNDFVHRIFFHFLPAEQAVSASDAGEEQPQVIKNLSTGCDSRSRITRRFLLLDGNRRPDPVDHADAGLLNPLQKLTRTY